MPIKIPTFVKDRAGSLYLNPDMIGFKGGFLLPPTGNQPTVVTKAGAAGAPNTTPPIPYESDADSYREILMLSGSFGASDPTDVQNRLMVEPLILFHGSRSLSNGPIIATHVFGTVLNPFVLEEDDERQSFGKSILLPPQSIIAFKFSNWATAGGAATANFTHFASATKIQTRVAHKRQNYAQIQRRLQEDVYLTPYWMSPMTSTVGGTSSGAGAPGIQLAASGSANIVFQNQSPGTFFVTSLMANAIAAGGSAGDTTELVQTEIYKSIPDDRAYQIQGSTLNMIWGTGAFPFRLKHPIVLQNGDMLRVNCKNLNTGSTTDFLPTLFGVMAYHDYEDLHGAYGERAVLNGPSWGSMPKGLKVNSFSDLVGV